MSDEALREIQLNGKQLVFLFMAATVVAVVIFLCGVMVGRGVRAPMVEQGEAITTTPVDPTASGGVRTAPATTERAPAVSNEELSYPNRLEGGSNPPEELEDVPEDPTLPKRAAPVTTRSRRAAGPEAPAAVVATPRDDTPVPGPKVTQPPVAPAVASTELSGSGYVVQVAATKQRGEAETIAKRLVNKGYQAYVTTPASGPKMFRVRVGKFSDRKDAERVASRLQREEQFKPWVTR